MDRILITGLGDAVQRAATIDTTRQVSVASVTVRHAPALLELLEGQKETKGWSIDRIGRLRKLSTLDNELTVVAEVLVPMLAENPLDATAGRALHSYGSSVPRLARSVGGDPLEPFNEFGRFLRCHALDADWLAINIEKVLAKVDAVKDVKVDFPDGGDPEEEGEGDGDGGGAGED